MSRRKNQIISSADGWSSVVGKGRSPLRSPSSLQDPGGAPIEYETWLPETRRILAEKQAEVMSSALWQTVTRAIEKLGGRGRVRKVVVLGLGSLSSSTKESSFYQLALVTEICALLRVYTSDPFLPSSTPDLADRARRWRGAPVLHSRSGVRRDGCPVFPGGPKGHRSPAPGGRSPHRRGNTAVCSASGV